MRNQYPVVKFIQQECADRFRVTRKVFDDVAEFSSHEMVKFLVTHRSDESSDDVMDCCTYVTEGLDTLRYLHYNRIGGCTTGAMNEAAEYGLIDIVRFLHEHRQEGCTTAAMDPAAKGGYLYVVMFLTENRNEGCTAGAMNGAAAMGHLDIVHYLHFQSDRRVYGQGNGRGSEEWSSPRRQVSSRTS